MNPSHLETRIEFNPFYRFSDILSCIFDLDNAEYPELKSVLINTLVHILTKYDMLQGMSKKRFYELFIYNELLQNPYGEKYANIINIFSVNNRWIVLNSMVKLYSLGPSLKILQNLLSNLYCDSMIYLENIEKRVLLVYMGMDKNENTAKEVNFILDLFVPIDYDVNLFWEKHFGLISVDETMIIDDFMIY